MTNFKDVRVFFNKIGIARYISHLDLYRAMGRTFSRSRLPVWITEGFNPHIYMTFALPLALGIEGKGGVESLDFRLDLNKQRENCDNEAETDFIEIVQKLNEQLPCGLEAVRAAVPVKKANEIHKAKYLIETESEQSALDDYLSQPEIKIVKKTKRNIQTIDVKPLLEYNRESHILTLPAGSELNINPWNVFQGENAQLEINKVTRVAIICKNGEMFR
jgi:radical SAM-linked protein